MAPYGWFIRNLRRATTFRDGRARTRPSLGKEPGIGDALHAGHRRKEKPAPAPMRFLRLAWPALLTVGLGLLNELARGGWRRIPYEMAACLMFAVSLVFAARAFSAADSRAVRYSATAVNLIFPVLALLFWTIG